MKVAGLVLAAGEGRRFGGPKALVEVDGVRLVDRAVRVLSDGGCGPVVVVAGAAPLVVPGATVVHNPDWPTGMGSSLRSGLAAIATTLRPVPDAVALLLVDTPWIGPESVRRLVASGAPAAAIATYGGRRGHPVLLRRGVWADVVAMATGDEGARAWLRAHPEQVLEVPCDGTGDPRDVDEPAHLTDPP